MRKRFLPLIIIALLTIPWEIKAQQPDQDTSQSVSKKPAVLSLLYNRVVIHRREGTYLSGLLVGVENDKLIIRIGERDEKLHYLNLSKVTIEIEKKRGRNLLSAILLGTYLGNLLFNRAKNQPTAYMKGKEPYGGNGSVLLSSAFYALVSGGVWYYVGSKFEREKKEFNFNGTEEKKAAKWERLRRYITGEFVSKKINLTTQASYVFTRVSSHYATLFKHAGYDIGSSSYMFDDYFEGAMDFNLLRKLQLTITAPSNNDFGIAVYWPGEPSVCGYRYDGNGSYYIDQVLYTTAYYAVIVLKPPRFQKSKRISLNIGIGAGMAQVDFKLRTSSETWNPSNWTYDTTRNQYNISKRLFSSVIFTELNFYLRDDLSLGLVADYVYIPSLQAPEIPEAGIPAQKLRLGNASVGFTLGLHF